MGYRREEYKSVNSQNWGLPAHTKAKNYFPQIVIARCFHLEQESVSSCRARGIKALVTDLLTGNLTRAPDDQRISPRQLEITRSIRQVAQQSPKWKLKRLLWSTPRDDSRSLFYFIETACKAALAEQKEEYLQLHQILLANQTAMQATIESLRAEIHKCMCGIIAATNDLNLMQNTPLPPSEFDNE